MQQGKTEKKYVACRKKAHKINFIFTFCYIWQKKHIFLKYNSSFLKIIGTGNRLNIISSFWKNMTIQKTSVVSPWLFKFLNSSSWLLQVLTDFSKRDLLFKVLLVLQAFSEPWLWESIINISKQLCYIRTSLDFTGK